MIKDAVATMGDILPADAGGRDAVHVAVFSALSKEKLNRGDHVGIVSSNGEDHVVAVGIQSNKVIGIVDPFLSKTVKPGQRFWVYLYPRTITGLFHSWKHPAFEDTNTVYETPASKVISEQWLRNFCDTHDLPDYDTVLKGAELVADNNIDIRYCGEDEYDGIGYDGHYLTSYGSDAHCEILPEFWDHASVVLGKPIKGKKPDYFSCSC